MPAVFGPSTSQDKLKDEVRVKQAELLQKQAGADASEKAAKAKQEEAELELKRREAYLREQRDKIKARKAAAGGAQPNKEEPWKAPYLPEDPSTPQGTTAAPPQLDMKAALAQRFKQDMLAAGLKKQ